MEFCEWLPVTGLGWNCGMLRDGLAGGFKVWKKGSLAAVMRCCSSPDWGAKFQHVENIGPQKSRKGLSHLFSGSSPDWGYRTPRLHVQANKIRVAGSWRLCSTLWRQGGSIMEAVNFGIRRDPFPIALPVQRGDSQCAHPRRRSTPAAHRDRRRTAGACRRSRRTA